MWKNHFADGIINYELFVTGNASSTARSKLISILFLVSDHVTGVNGRGFQI